MANSDDKKDKREQARSLTEQALEKLEEGDEAAADRLVEEAKRIDPAGAKEVLEDLEEDAATRGETTSPEDDDP